MSEYERLMMFKNMEIDREALKPRAPYLIPAKSFPGKCLQWLGGILWIVGILFVLFCIAVFGTDLPR